MDEYAHVLNPGDRVVFSLVEATEVDITEGREYEIYEDNGSAFFWDDAGDIREYPLLREAIEDGYQYQVVNVQLEND